MKSSFVLYTDYLEHIALLNMEQRGVLFTALMNYAARMDMPEMDGMTKMAFSFIKAQMDRDKEKYETTIEKRREAGKKGGRPKANGFDEKAKKANGFFEKQNNPVNVNVNVNDNVNDKDIKDILSSTSADNAPEYEYKAVIDYLNIKAGTKFMDKSNDTRKHIKARFNEGFTLDDFKTVISKKVDEWKGTEMEKFIRPSTLFGTKFESYLNQKIIRPNKNKFTNFEQRDYNMDDLEKKLLGGGS